MTLLPLSYKQKCPKIFYVFTVSSRCSVYEPCLVFLELDDFDPTVLKPQFLTLILNRTYTYHWQPLPSLLIQKKKDTGMWTLIKYHLEV